jgi:protein-S-isoprenylcysteine O-methyltransferase Ste14
MTEGYTRSHYAHRSDLAGEHRWGDTGQLILILVFIIGTGLDLFVFDLSSAWQGMVPWYLRVLVFLPLFFAAGYFAQRSHTLIFGQKREKLMVIDTGVYARLRHPMYFAALLTYLGFVILSLSAVSLVIFVVTLVFYVFISRYEEQVLVERLGDDYRRYKQTVPMLVPKFW